MSKRGLKLSLLTLKFHFSSSTPSRPCLPRLSFLTRTLSTSSPPDGSNLPGLIDPETEFQSEDSKVEAFSSEEFAFLKESLLNSPPGDQVKVLSRTCSNDVYLICNAIRDSNDGFGDKSRKCLRQFRQKLNESLVIDVLRNLQACELCVKFFIWAGRQIGYAHTRPVYDALLEVLDMSRDGRIPEPFLKEIKNDDREVLGKLLNVLIRKCCQNGLWNLALEELGRLKDFGYKPTRVTYNALVLVFLKADKFDTAYLVHKEMSDLGFRMDEYTLGYFVNTLCKLGRWREALSLIEKEEFVADTVMYTKMISGLCEASLFEEAMDFLNRMRANSCIPNVVTYRILLTGCLNKRQLGRCKRILNMMIQEGCFPSPRIFNSLVHAYCKSRDYSYAYKLLKKMQSCGCQPGYVVYNILIGGICGNEELPASDQLQLAERAYIEMLDSGVVLNKINVSNFARCLCGAGKSDHAYRVIREMMVKGFVPDTSTYSKVIGFLCNASKVERAFLLFEEMKINKVVPDVFTYTVLIDNFCKAGLIEQARNWFEEMIINGCSPNIVTYTALIHAYLKARMLAHANELFERMLSEGCIPNVITYTALIDGYCKAKEIETACRIYTKMRGDKKNSDVDIYFRIDDGNTREPNVYTYGALVDGLCKAHKVNEACDLLDAISEEGCEPNHIVYDALIDGFCKVGKLDEAQVVFAKMSERGYNPNEYTYSSLIDRLFKDRRLDLALKVLSKMLENFCAPNVIIYTEMIDGLCKVGKTDEAYKLMVMMDEKGCHPNVVTYTAMIDGFGRAGNINKCLELLTQMCAKGCAPNYITYRVLINHCCAAGFLDDAHRILEEMKQMYWPKHMASYCKVIEGFKREFIVSLGLLDDVSESHLAPILPAYKILIDSFCKAGRLRKALELHEEISSSNHFSVISNNIYHSLIESLCLANMVDKAIELYSDMINRGGRPLTTTIFQLVKGLTRDGRWGEALQLADSISQMNICWVSEDS